MSTKSEMVGALLDVTKHCVGCGLVVPSGSFYSRAFAPDGRLRGVCGACVRKESNRQDPLSDHYGFIEGSTRYWLSRIRSGKYDY